MLVLSLQHCADCFTTGLFIPIIPGDLGTCISRCINLMLADSCWAWLDEKHPRQTWHSLYSPAKATVISECRTVQVHQIWWAESRALTLHASLPPVGCVAVCTSSLSQLPHRVRQVPTSGGRMLWSIWLCVLLPGKEQYLKPSSIADAFLFRSL